MLLTAWKHTELVFCYQNCSRDHENFLKFGTEGQEFAKCLRLLEQYSSSESQKNFW